MSIARENKVERILLSGKKKKYLVSIQCECNYIAGEPFLKSLDLVSDVDNSKHLCLETRNSCFVLLKGFYGCVYLFLSSFMCVL